MLIMDIQIVIRFSFSLEVPHSRMHAGWVQGHNGFLLGTSGEYFSKDKRATSPGKVLLCISVLPGQDACKRAEAKSATGYEVARSCAVLLWQGGHPGIGGQNNFQGVHRSHLASQWPIKEQL